MSLFDRFRSFVNKTLHRVEEAIEDYIPEEEVSSSRHVEDEEPVYSQEEETAQQIWDDTVSDIVSNVEMEPKFTDFVSQRIDTWQATNSMDSTDVRALISWLIINANTVITHDDVTAILDRIYEAMATGS